ncbi:MAG: hypothetical protein ACOCUL_00165 [Bacteroidota bacterium]
MKIEKLTGLGRPLDSKYPTNKAISAIIIISILVGMSIEWISGAAWYSGLFKGIGVGLSIFFAWAIARELDPDHDYSAFVVVFLSIGGIILWSQPGFLQLFWILLASRTVNRTTGLHANVLDSILVTGLNFWLVWEGNWPYGLLTVFVFLLDAHLFPRLKKQYIFAFLNFLFILVAALVGIYPLNFSLPPKWVILMQVILSIAFIPVILSSKQMSSKGDKSGIRLSPTRQIATQLLMVTLGILLTFSNGAKGFKDFFVFWAAIGGTALYWYILKIKFLVIRQEK